MKRMLRSSTLLLHLLQIGKNTSRFANGQHITCKSEIPRLMSIDYSDCSASLRCLFWMLITLAATLCFWN